jgi:AcrR family transcriptional regulator
VRQERSERRRERILDAAFTVFSRRGYREAGVDEVGRQAETSKGGVYFHFPSKESLFLELLRTTADRLVGKVERAIAGIEDPVERADVALRRCSRCSPVIAPWPDSSSSTPSARACLRTSCNGSTSASARSSPSSSQRRWRRAASPIDTAVAATAWFGALNEVVMRWLMGEPHGRLEDSYGPSRTPLRSVGIPRRASRR